MRTPTSRSTQQSSGVQIDLPRHWGVAALRTRRAVRQHTWPHTAMAQALPGPGKTFDHCASDRGRGRVVVSRRHPARKKRNGIAPRLHWGCNPRRGRRQDPRRNRSSVRALRCARLRAAGDRDLAWDRWGNRPMKSFGRGPRRMNELHGHGPRRPGTQRQGYK